VEQGVRKPDFFIVGAQKCGTTALYEYLKQHPDVFMPDRKEAHFFAPDLDSGAEIDKLFFIRDMEEYLNLFAAAGNEKRVGEASPGYLYSRVAASRIKEFCPQANIIIMLRNPVDMIYSLHAQRVHSGNEDIDDFESALNAEQDRSNGLRMPKYAYNAKSLLYRETAKYADQVQRFMDNFGRDKIQVIIFDDFIKDTLRIYQETCRFLDIDASFEPQIEVVNPNTTSRSKLVRNLLLFHTLTLQKAIKSLPAPVEEAAKRVGKTVLNFNTKTQPRPSMSLELRHRLQAEFAPDVEKLSKLLNRDLTSLWTPAG
jgi:hypothetical protein